MFTPESAEEICRGVLEFVLSGNRTRIASVFWGPFTAASGKSVLGAARVFDSAGSWRVIPKGKRRMNRMKVARRRKANHNPWRLSKERVFVYREKQTVTRGTVRGFQKG